MLLRHFIRSRAVGQPENLIIHCWNSLPFTSKYTSNSQQIKGKRMATPEESIEMPSWLDKAFFELALTRDYPGVRVRSVHVEPAVAVGENYACIVYRAVVGREEGSDVHLIVKCLPTNEFRAKMVRDGQITLREVRMYKETLPLLEHPCKHPTCHHALMDDVWDAVVLEDLRPKGYRTRDRKLGLDLAHTKLVMQQIGRLHGSGIALRINDPETFNREILTKYPDVMFSESNRDMMSPFSKMTMEALAGAVELNFPMRFQPLAAIMREMSDATFDLMKDGMTLPTDPEELDNTVLTLNHGDTWSNNILFKYKDGDLTNPLDCVLIDFQISRAVPAVMDLLYFFYSSTSQDLRRNHMDELLQIYWDAVREILGEKGVTYPGRYFYDSVSDIKNELKKHALTGFLLGAFIMPIVVANADDVPDMDSITEEQMQKMEESPFLKIYSGPLFCKRFREIVEDCDDLGAFDKNVWKQYVKPAVDA